jgi:hypothetical protein
MQQSCTPSIARAPSIVHAPLALMNARPLTQHRAPMVSYTMINLKKEINHHRGGEDSCTAIEHHHERW